MKRIWLRALTAACVLFACALPAHALEISEVCQSNAVYFRVDEGEYTDGIELYNPTEKPNTEGRAYMKPVYVASPVFSRESGFYDSAFDLTIEANINDKIYYTLDSSEPNENSALYAGTVAITDASYHKNEFSTRTDVTYNKYSPPNVLLPKATIVKAVAIDENGNKSKVAQCEYFIGFKDRHMFDDIKIVSVSADPNALFGRETGIYVLGEKYEQWLNSDKYDPDYDKFLLPINFLGRGNESEVKASVSVFERDKALSACQSLGLRIHGTTQRVNAKKSLRLYARPEYSSDGAIQFKYTDGEIRGETLVIRNGGSNQVLCFIDVFAHELLSSTGLPTSRSEACALFLNGEYWGLYNLREHIDETYIADFYGVEKDDIILISDGDVKAGVAGDYTDYENTVKQIAEMKCETDEQYAAVDALIDIDSYTNYLAGGLYIQAANRLNNENASVWRARDAGKREYADARWRWIYQDMDVSCGMGDMSTTPVQSLLNEEIFSALWTNADYRNKFLNSVMDISNFDCAPKKVNALLNEYAEYYRRYVELNYSRYYPNNTIQKFDSQVEGIRDFFNNRQAQIVEQLKDALQMDRDARYISVKTSGAGANGVRVNGYAPDFNGNEWTGMYFEGTDITLEARKEAGYDFKGWYMGDSKISDSLACVVTLDSDAIYTAAYEEIPVIIELDNGHSPMTGSNGEFLLSSGTFSYTAALISDESVSVSLQDGYMPAYKCKKDAWGVVLKFDAAGQRDMSAHVSVLTGSDANVKWLFSSDGVNFTLIDGGEFVVCSPETEFAFALPQEANDLSEAYLRVETNDASALTFAEIKIRGRETDVSLAEYGRVAKKLKNEKVDYEFASTYEMTQEQVNSETQKMRKALAEALIERTLKKLKYINIQSPALDGLSESLCVEISAANAVLTDELNIDISAEYSLDTVYVYRLEGGGLNDMGMRNIDGGVITFSASPGLYILLDTPMSEYIYETGLRADPIPADLIMADFMGVTPERHLWLDIEVKTASAANIEFEIPPEYDFPKVDARVYEYSGGTLTARGLASVAENGKYALNNMKTGEYLLLTETLYDYRKQSDASVEKPVIADNEFDKTKLVYGTLALLALFIAIGVFIKIKRTK